MHEDRRAVSDQRCAPLDGASLPEPRAVAGAADSRSEAAALRAGARRAAGGDPAAAGGGARVAGDPRAAGAGAGAGRKPGAGHGPGGMAVRISAVHTSLVACIMLVRYLARKRAAPCAGIAGAGSPAAGMAGEGRLRAGWRGPGVSGSQEALRNEAHRLRKALEGPAVVARIPRTMRLLRRHILRSLPFVYPDSPKTNRRPGIPPVRRLSLASILPSPAHRRGHIVRTSC